MTSRLSSDTIAQMAPLLGSLSRLVARGSHISEVQLRTLLRGIDLEVEPAVMHEAKFWMELLQDLREDSSEKYLCEGYSGNLNFLLQLDVIAELL